VLRSLFISLFMTGSALSLVPVEKPPSSLAPQSGKVAFSHASQKTIGCVPKGKGKDLKCSPELTTIDRSAAIKLHPVATPDVTEKDGRQAVNVSIPRGTATVEVPLARGVWELEWPGRSERDRFFVARGDELSIALTTRLGSCKKAKDECVLNTDGTAQKVSIPKESRR
jgi:hypothetical protein